MLISGFLFVDDRDDYDERMSTEISANDHKKSRFEVGIERDDGSEDTCADHIRHAITVICWLFKTPPFVSTMVMQTIHRHRKTMSRSQILLLKKAPMEQRRVCEDV